MRLLTTHEWILASMAAYAKHGKVHLLWTTVINPDQTIASIMDVSAFEKELW